MAASERPVYLRLRDEIVAMILDGRIQEGDALPSVRAFAADQGANPLTVAKAYQSFQEAAQRLRATARARFIDEEWPEIASRIRRLGIDPAELLDRITA